MPIGDSWTNGSFLFALMLKILIFKFILTSIVSLLHLKSKDTKFNGIVYPRHYVYELCAYKSLYPSGIHYEIWLYFSLSLFILCSFWMIYSLYFCGIHSKCLTFSPFPFHSWNHKYEIHNIWLISRPFDWNQINSENWIAKHTILQHKISTYGRLYSNVYKIKWIILNIRHTNQVSAINRLDENGLPHNNILTFIKRNGQKLGTTSIKIRFVFFFCFGYWIDCLRKASTGNRNDH